MKKFDIELAKKGDKVCTRDGRKVRIISYDRKDRDYPIVALITQVDEESGNVYEITKDYTIDGKFMKNEYENKLDLFIDDGVKAKVKSFDMELAMKGAKIRTISGGPVRILCYDRDSDCLTEKRYPIIALVRSCGVEHTEEYTDKGKARKNSYNDLVIVEGEPEEWRTTYSVNKDPDLFGDLFLNDNNV